MSRDQQIDRIVADTGMGRLQAHYHLQGREAAIAADQRRRRVAAAQPLDTFQPVGEVAAPVVAHLADALPRLTLFEALDKVEAAGGELIIDGDRMIGTLRWPGPTGMYDVGEYRL